MKLIIDIPDEEYEEILSSENCGLHTLTRAVANGTPVPTDAVDRITIKEYLDSYNDVPETNVGKIGKDTTTSELNTVRHELLERKDELVSFGQLIERFDDVDAEYSGSSWTLKQIYANFNILIGIESVESPSHNRVKTELESCADMVSRDAMWEVLQRLYGTEGELVEELMSLPPVLPMPKIGKWIYKKEEDTYRCSLCTFPCHKDNMGAIPTRYCAECGAVMEEME